MKLQKGVEAFLDALYNKFEGKQRNKQASKQTNIQNKQTKPNQTNKNKQDKAWVFGLLLTGEVR